MTPPAPRPSLPATDSARPGRWGHPRRLPARLRHLHERAVHRLESEVFSGSLMVGAALIALVWANSPWRGAYEAVSALRVGPHALHLDLTLAGWAADGLLAIFFLVVGLELKQELVVGSLRDLREAALPMLAAVFGMAGPAVVYTLIQAATGSGAWNGWAVPTATDIAFALAVLSLFGRGLPPAARTFLLTLAVVDDLLAIIVIAAFYSQGLAWLPLVGALVCVGVFGLLVQRSITRWWLLVPIGVVAWGLMHASGVHATIAGVLLGLTVPARPTRREPTGMTARLTHRIHPLSAGIVLPLFALMAAGVDVVDGGGLASVLTDPVAVGVYVALPVGKILGIWGSVVLLTRFTRLRLGHGVDNADILAVSAVTGIGFTVSLLIASLAFDDAAAASHARAAVLVGTFLSAALGAVLLRRRVRTTRRGTGSTRTRVWRRRMR